MFPRVNRKQNLLFPMGPVIKCFVIPPNSKIEQILWPTEARKHVLNEAGFSLQLFQGARPDHMQVESSSCCFPRELVSFVYPTHGT